MVMLEAAMAFAIAMIIFSTLVTGIVELLHRSLGTRERNLKNTIESLFNTIIWPRMSSHLANPAVEAAEMARRRLSKQFVQDMVGNPVSKPGYFKGKVDVLTPLAFAERLGRTDVGKAILVEGEAQLDLLVQDFVRSFDRFGRTASEVFRKKAQQTAMVVGVLLALAVNIDAGRLIITLVENPSLRAGLIAQAEQAAKENQTALNKLDDVAKAAKQEKLEGNQIQAIKDGAEALRQRVLALESEGLPIGFSFYPWCNLGTTDAMCMREELKDTQGKIWQTAVSDPLTFMRWVALCVISGILIGLGGPFWFRVFSSLSQIMQALRVLGAERSRESKETTEKPAQSELQETAKPKNPKDAFLVAAQVHAHASTTEKRALLGPDGEPL